MAGSVTWDGKSHTLLSLVPLGVYYYRVVVTDQAGNVSHGGESKLASRSLTATAPVL